MSQIKVPNSKRELAAFVRSVGLVMETGTKHERIIDPADGTLVAIAPQGAKAYRGVNRKMKNTIAQISRHLARKESQ